MIIFLGLFHALCNPWLVVRLELVGLVCAPGESDSWHGPSRQRVWRTSPTPPAFSAALPVHLSKFIRLDDGLAAGWRSDALPGPAMRVSAGKFAVMASPVVSSVHTSVCVVRILQRSHHKAGKRTWPEAQLLPSAGRLAPNRGKEVSLKGLSLLGYYHSPYQPRSCRTQIRASSMSSCTNMNDMCTR